MVVLDDLGFAQLGCYGSDVATPHLDALADGGLRYNRFHVTALCSPTRACLLTGRNHHAVGVGFLPDMPIAHPGYRGRVPESAAPLPRILRDAGYNTYCVGKWHLTPGGERGAAGPFDRWPLGFGFERYYGFLHGDANHWAPNLVRDNHYVEPASTPGDGYHLTEDLATQAVHYVTQQQQAAPNRPFFLYLALGAVHSPHHVTPEWSDPYRGRFDDGWDAWRHRVHARQLDLGISPAGTELAPRPEWIPDWDDLGPDERRTFGRQMEVFAGFLTHTDAQIGRVVDQLARLGVLDDTIVMVVSDNGASAEGGVVGTFNEHRFTEHVPDTSERNAEYDDVLGGPRTYPHYAWGWAWAGNTPLRLWKRYTWLGGTRTPLLVHWPGGVPARGEVRPQFVHAIDLMPTILDLAGVAAPDVVDGVVQQPIDGASILATFTDPSASEARSVQYFEMLGSRAIYADGWKATTDHVSKGVVDEEALLPGSRDFDQDRWSLFDLEHDFAEAHDVAADHPDTLRELIARWEEEATRNQVFPLIDDLIARISAMVPPPNPLPTTIVFRPEGSPVPDDSVPRMFAGVEIAARVTVLPGHQAHGVLCAMGDWTGGFALYVRDGRLTVAVSRAGDHFLLRGDETVAPGDHTLSVSYRPAGPDLELRCDGEVVAGSLLPFRLPMVWQHGGTSLRLGEDRGLPVTDDYEVPFRWTGILHDVTITTPELAPRPADAARAALHQD
jgi:arylsulfatase